MIYSTPELKKRIRRVKDVSKEGVNLDNMTIYPAWSNSPGTMSSLPMKRVVWDEVRLMSQSGIRYALERTLDLSQPVSPWNRIATADGNGLELILQDTDQPSGQASYFRVVSVP